VTIKGKPYARLLFVIGTSNPGWTKNYDLCRKIIAKLEEEYPGLSRGVLYESAVYNQKYSPNAILVECGGVSNTFAECQNSMEALALALSTVISQAPASH